MRYKIVIIAVLSLLSNKIISQTNEINNSNAKLVQEAKFDNQSELQIDLSQRLKAGIYVLKVITENNTYTEKIILKK